MIAGSRQRSDETIREEFMNRMVLIAAMAAAIALSASPASAQTSEITIGISISTTGPAAALGVPERNALEFVPKEIADRKSVV